MVQHFAAGADRQRHRLGKLLPDGLQRFQIGVTPFLLAVGGEGGSHAAAST